MMIPDKKWIWALAGISVLIGSGILLFGEPVITYMYRNPVRLPVLGDLLGGRDQHPLAHYLEVSTVLRHYAIVFIKIGLLLAAICGTRMVMQIASLIAAHRPVTTRIRTACTISLVIIAGCLAALSTTPQIEFGEGKEGKGYGHDGVHYGKIADDFRPFETSAALPFAHRILPSAAVSYMGIGTFRGFQAINLLCYVLSCVLMYRLLRFYKIERSASVLGVGFLVCLKFGLKFWLYYPVQTDGFGTLLLLGIVYAAVSRTQILYLICMTLAVVSRENLLALIPFHILCTFCLVASPRQRVWAALLNTIPVACFFISRHFPLVEGYGEYHATGAVLSYTKMFLVNPGRQLRFFFAHINSLGVLAVLPLLMWKTSYKFLIRHWYWCYFILLNLVFSIVGGSDIDRFALWQAPILILLIVHELRNEAALVVLGHFLVMQVVWSELLIPWWPDMRFYLSRYAVHSRSADAFLMCLSCISLVAAVAIVYRRCLLAKRQENCPTNESSAALR